MTRLGLTIGLVCCVGAVSRGQQWTNGMNANGILGQTGFTTSLNNRFITYPAGIAVDPTTGKVFVADNGRYRIVRWSSVNSLINGSPAEAVLGQPDFLTKNTNIPTQSVVAGVRGIAVDRSGALWVADPDFHRVLRFDSASAKSSGANADGVLGQSSFTSDTVSLSQAGMNAPYGVAVDSSGTLWVVEKGNSRVLRFTHAASKPNGGNADGVLGSNSFNVIHNDLTQSGMTFPTGIAVDNTGRVWVADNYNNRVLRYDHAALKANGGTADGVLGQTSFTTGTAATTQSGMNQPWGVAVDNAGTLWVSEVANDRVLRFDDASSKSNGGTADGVLGQPLFTTSAMGTTPSSMQYPFGLATDSSGRLWVGDWSNDRVLRFDHAFSKSNGGSADGVLGSTSYTGSAFSLPGVLNSPACVAADPTTGNIFVADQQNHRVLRWSSVNSFINGSSAEGVLGQPDLTSHLGATSQAGMRYPSGVAVDSSGRLWVADKLNNRVLRFDSASARPNGANADGVLGQSSYTASSYNTTLSTMFYPSSVAVDGAGRVWVADNQNSRVLRFDNAASKANGAYADDLLGQPSTVTRASATTQSGMNLPLGVAVDGSGRLWVADGNNHRVLRFDNAASKLTGADADGELGQSSFSSGTATTTQSGMSTPSGVAVDGAGRLFVADNGNSRVLRFDNAAGRANGANADGVLGQSTYVTTAKAATQSGMSGPTAIAIDGSGTLWVADEGNSRILRFDLGSLTSVTWQTTPAGAEKFELSQNYPNPFNPTTVVRYAVPVVALSPEPRASRGVEGSKGGSGLGTVVSLRVYDLLGREVATLVNETKPPGTYEVTFNGNGLASGVYFYRLRAGSFVETRKFVLQK